MTMQPEINDTLPTRFATREEWLQEAVNMFRNTFERELSSDPEFDLAFGIPEDLLVGVGFPYGTGPESAGIRAVTYIRGCTVDGRPQVFMCPTYDDPVVILRILMHELIHVADDCQSGHSGFFQKLAKRFGYEGPFSDSANATELLLMEFADMAKVLGRYPHSRMDIDVLTGKKLPQNLRQPVGPNGETLPEDVGITIAAGKRRVTSGPRRQTNRHHSWSCMNDQCPSWRLTGGRGNGYGYTVNVARVFSELATPICPVCRLDMSQS